MRPLSAVKFRVTLTKGAHRLRAVLRCQSDFAALVAGEDTIYDWSKSAFSKENPPNFCTAVPVNFHFAGARDVPEYLKRSMKLRRALIQCSMEARSYNFGDNIYFINAMRYGRELQNVWILHEKHFLWITCGRRTAMVLVAYVVFSLEVHALTFFSRGKQAVCFV